MFKRLTGETPKLFRIIRNVALFAIAIAGTLLGTPLLTPELAIIATHVVAISTGVAGISQLVTPTDLVSKELASSIETTAKAVGVAANVVSDIQNKESPIKIAGEVITGIEDVKNKLDV